MTQYVLWQTDLWSDGLWGPLLWETTGAGAAGDESKSRKRRYIVRKNGRLLVFPAAEMAAAALETKPHKAVQLATVRKLAKDRGETKVVNELLAKAQYEALMALIERMIDEEDEELLMLAA